MTNKQNQKFQELVAKLREIFQIDRLELDFGIYRILNARADEINDYLQNRLAEKVQAALSAGSAESSKQWQAELQEAEKNAQALGVSPDDVPKVMELRAKLKEAKAGSNEHENAVYTHLLTFFSRYYQDGDFISQRRYKGDTYAIPYAGEEVMLYWANKDQYYTKSGENFNNYRFKLEDGRTVHFRLVAADTAKDNRKDSDKERRFALITTKTVTRVDENGDEYEEELVPVEEVIGADGNQELVIRFEYAAQPNGTKQEALVTQAIEAVLADAAVKSRWLALGNRMPTEKNPQRTLLEKHLSDYTTKNTADYFIHKDLGGFLRRELDFYIKNEVMHLDDVQNASAFADIEKNLRMIQCLRAIALELISFLAQLEDFQKKLWLKKKFVVSSHYCITLDRVPEELYPQIATNEAQIEEWIKLYAIDEVGKAASHEDEKTVQFRRPLTVEFLKANNKLVLDTRFFDESFMARLLASIENFDEQCDGLLIHSENFHALNLLQDRYREQVKCVYIDPPYNTSATEILYKNSYKHSSWLALMQDRVSSSFGYLQRDGILCIAIDDFEGAKLQGILDDIIGFDNRLGNIVVVHNPGGRHDDKFIATAHEYCFFYAKNIHYATTNFLPLEEKDIDSFKYSDENGAFRVREFRRSGNNSTREARPKMFYPLLIKNGKISLVDENEYARLYNKKTGIFDDNYLIEIKIKYENQGFDFVLPIDPNGIYRVWRWAPESFRQRSDEIFADKKDRYVVKVKDRLENKPGLKPKSVWYKPKYTAALGTNILSAIIGDLGLFSYPKSISTVEDSIRIGANNNSLVFDYFAGSGTTGHAVINLNREDGGKRKYILVEMGDYFDTVLKLRLAKVVYSDRWKDGKPTARHTGITHFFKYIRLESYEDTLNNLQLGRTSAQGDLLNTLPQLAKDDYLLHYMLNVESRVSLLSVEDFKKPFDYTLNISVDSAGAYEPRKIDLVETFNYLIGLRVKHIDMQPGRGFVTVTGTLPSGESCLVLWRDCEKLDYDGIAKLCDKLAINPADNEFDVVYINGDHNIPTVLTQTADEGGATRVLKLRQIEPEFLERMFSVEDI